MVVCGFSTFVILIILLLLTWTIVSFWQRFLENLAFVTLEYDPRDTWVTLWLALSLTFILIFIVWVIKVTLFPRVDTSLVGGSGDSGETGIFEEGSVGDRFSPSVLDSTNRIPFI